MKRQTANHLVSHRPSHSEFPPRVCRVLEHFACFISRASWSHNQRQYRRISLPPSSMALGQKLWDRKITEIIEAIKLCGWGDWGSTNRFKSSSFLRFDSFRSPSHYYFDRSKWFLNGREIRTILTSFLGSAHATICDADDQTIFETRSLGEVLKYKKFIFKHFRSYQTQFVYEVCPGNHLKRW